jgi:hypothetical protein
MRTHLFRYASIGFVCVGVAVGSGYAQEPKQSGRPPDASAGTEEVVPQEPAQPADSPAGPSKLVLTGDAARQILDLIGAKVNAAEATVGQELGVVKGVLLLPRAGQAKGAAPAVGRLHILSDGAAPQPTQSDVIAVAVRVRVLAAAPVRSCAAVSRTTSRDTLTLEIPVVPQAPARPAACSQLAPQAFGLTLEAATSARTSARILGTVLVPVQPSVGAWYTDEAFVVPRIVGTSALYADDAMLADLRLRREFTNARLGLAPDGSVDGRTWKTETYRGTALTPYFFKQERPGDNWLWFRDLEKEQEARRRITTRTPSRVMHSW